MRPAFCRILLIVGKVILNHITAEHNRHAIPFMNILDHFWMAFPGVKGEPAKCCGRYPLLRLSQLLVFKNIIDYVEFECQECNAKGGRALNETEAIQLWNEKNG